MAIAAPIPLRMYLGRVLRGGDRKGERQVPTQSRFCGNAFGYMRSEGF